MQTREEVLLGRSAQARCQLSENRDNDSSLEQLLRAGAGMCPLHQTVRRVVA